MPRPFEALHERLLRAGVAPRHARRYEGELCDHLDDLIAMQKARGYDGDDAMLRARALLGPDDELAGAMIGVPQFQSLAARAPWLVFGVVPPFLIFALLAGVGMMMLGVWALLPGLHPAPPAWLGTVAQGWATLANLGSGPLAAAFFVVIAVNQRQSWQWPLFAVVSTAFYSAFTVFIVRLPDHGKLGEVGVGLSATSARLWENGARFALTVAVVMAAYGMLRCHRRTAT